MPTLSSKRIPWPWDARLLLLKQGEGGGQIGDFRGQTIGSLRGTMIGNLRPHSATFSQSKGFMLIPQQDTSLLVGRKQTNLETLYPPTAEYSSAPVYRERTFMFRPTGGLGEPVQSSAGDRRYHYGINVWCSGGLFGKGPKSNSVVPSAGATGMVRRFIEALDGGALALFYLAGERVFRRTDDSAAGQTVSRDRPGLVAMDAVRFTGAYAGAADSLYVAWSDGVLEEYNGSTWTACALPAGFSANYLEVLGDQLWVADSARSQIRNAAADPKVAGSWSGPILIGNPSEKITAIRQTSNRLLILKDSGGVFTVNTDGSDSDLFPGIEATPSMDNGRTAWPWLGSLWFRMGRAFYELQMPSAVLKPAGPGRNLSNSSEVKGPVQAWCGWNTQMAFAAIYNEGLNNSYLLSYGNWIPRAEASDSGSSVVGSNYVFADQYDGAIVRWTNRKATALFVSNIPSEARLYIGFADGAYEWIKLVPYPLSPDAASQGAEYTSDQSYIVTPLHHAMFQADAKHWTGVSIFGPKFASGDSVFVSYRLRGSSSGPAATAIGDYLAFGEQPMTHSGERRDATRPIAGQALELMVALNSTSAGSTPILEGVGLHERLVPRFRRDWTMTINANDFIARRDGAAQRQSSQGIRQLLEDAASAPASISLVLPDERVSDVALFSYEERQVPHSQRGGLGWAIAVQATQFTTQDLYGIVKRLRGTLIGDLRGYTIDQLRLM